MDKQSVRNIVQVIHFVRDIVQVIQVVSNGYCYVLGLGLEPDNVLDKLYDCPLYGTLE